MKKRTIYISEKLLKEDTLKNAFIEKDIPNKFIEMAEKNKFPFNKNSAFPEIYDEKFILKILKERYKECKENILALGDIEDFNSINISEIISKMLLEINKMEKGNEEKLEKLCNNFVIDTFNIPEDYIDFDIKITNQIEGDGLELQLDPEDTSVTYNNIKDAEEFNKEVKKRLVINMLIAGASEYYSEKIDSFANDIYTINPKLLNLYGKLEILNRYTLISEPNIKQTEKDKKEIGAVNTKLGNDIYKSLIISRGATFPIVLYETVKGLMELFASHGLPKDISLTNSILKKTEYAKAELWNMRIGRVLWDKLIKAIDEVDDKKIPYIFMEISKLSPSKFNKIMKEVFAETKRGKKFIKDLTENIEYTLFLDKMKKANTEKNVIEDEYIHPKEL